MSMSILNKFYFFIYFLFLAICLLLLYFLFLLSLFFYFLVVFILAIIFVSLAYGFSLIFINRKNILIATKDSNKELILSLLNVFKSVKRVKYVALYFLLPIILSFIMIYVCSFIIPRGDVDVGEINVKVWILLLTILMSFLPIIINFFFVNTLNIESFHTPLGYTFFVNSCLYATYFPIFIFSYIQKETYPFEIQILLILITLLIGNILGRSCFKYGIKTKNSYIKCATKLDLTHFRHFTRQNCLKVFTMVVNEADRKQGRNMRPC